jgi:hypothetical protein
MDRIEDILVPDIGEFDAVEVIEVLVKSGDIVSAEDPLLTMESDKASMDVPSTFGGTVKAVKIKAGDRVSQNDLILTMIVVEESENVALETAPKTALSEGTAPETEDSVSGSKPETESSVSGAVPSDRAVLGAVSRATFSDSSTTIIVRIRSFCETLSPAFIFTALTVPPNVEGTSIDALSLSIVSKGSSAETMSPDLTRTSMTSTASNSPMSGTSISSILSIEFLLSTSMDYFFRDQFRIFLWQN